MIAKDVWNRIDSARNVISSFTGFTFPDLAVLKTCTTSSLPPEAITKYVVSGSGDNYLFYTDSKCAHPVRITFHSGASNNILIFGEGAEVYGHVNLHGSGNIIVIGSNIKQWSMLNLRLWSNNQLFFWGEGSTSNGVEIVMQGNEQKVLIGDDCMFANNIYIRNSDMHPLIDLSKKTWINKPADVVIESHVWVCQEVLILKGVTIGKGSTIGAKSLVNKNIPKYSLAAGSPAKVLKNNVSWDRVEFPRAEVIELLSNDCMNGFEKDE